MTLLLRKLSWNDLMMEIKGDGSIVYVKLSSLRHTVASNYVSLQKASETGRNTRVEATDVC